MMSACFGSREQTFVSNPPGLERREVLYRGQVQGVGFRYTTDHIAQQHEVSGFVRNLADGSVQLIAEGETNELDRFIAELAQTMSDNISEAEVQSTTATGEYQDFEIRY